MSAELIHQMYIAYYQRPADPAGLIYWQDQLNTNGGGEAGWNAVAAAFANAAESSALYGNQTLGQKISAIYLAAFERAASADEVAYWEASGFNAAQIGFAIVNGAQNDDLSTVTKKVDYAEAFVSTLDPAGTGVGPFAFQYVDPSLGRGLMDVITKDSDVSAATVSSQVSSTLPTLVTVNLTSGADTVTPTANAAEEINAALGGSSPSLGRTDTIDGGSAQDTINVAMDGNFLLGFSSGTMKDVEIVNLAATASSVTPKTFNFTGASGIETINVGAGNAPIIVSNISDTGLTLNLSGQSTGAFDVGFATGTISGSGSSLTVGLTDVGSTGTNVSLTANLITEMDLVSYGTDNHIDLSGSVNDIKNISVSGAGDLVIAGVPSTASGFTAASAGGDVTLTVDTDSNTVMLASGQTITGGAGFDSLSIQGSGIAATASTGIEELIFDGASTEAIVRATGMAGLNTLTYSGNSSASVSGLQDQALTVNAILDGAGQQVVVSSSGTLAVNLNANPTQVALANRTDNDFDFKATTTAGIDITVGSYTSASGTYVLNNSTGDVGITVDSTSVFGSHVQASGASTISILGNGGIAAAVSGQNTQTITVNANSGTLAVGSSAATTFNLTTLSNITLGSTTSRLSGVQTMAINIGSNTADLSGTNLGFQDMRTMTLTGTGSGATVLLNDVSGSGNAMAITMTGLEGGVSAFNVSNASGNITIAAESLTGTLDVATLETSAAGSITVSTGTAGNFSAGTVKAIDAFTLDASANVSGSASIAISDLSASGAISISLGSAASGDVTLLDVEGESTFTLDGSNFGGTIDLGTFTAGGNTTISMGTEGYFSASTIGTAGSFTLDGAAATTGQTTIQGLSAGAGVTVAMGTGTGGVTLVSSITAGNFTLDASTFAGTIDATGISASGSIVVSVGTNGDFSAGHVGTLAAFTVDAASSQSGAVTITGVSAGGNLTVSMGAGTGALTMNSSVTTGNFTVDASSFGGAIDISTVTGSGAATISVGSSGDFSADQVAVQGAFTLDAAAATTGSITLAGITAGGNLTIAMGQGTGSIVLTSAITAGNFTLDGTTFGGAIDIANVTASGAVVVSTGSAGDLSATQIHTTGAVTIDGAAASTGAVTLNTVSASGAVTISMGSGSGALAVTGSVETDKGLIIDASSFGGSVDVAGISASGATTVSLSGGDYSAGNTFVNGTFTLDASTSTTGTVTLTAFSAGGNSTINLGGGSGAIAVGSAQAGGSFSIDATSFTGTTTITTVSASGAVTVALSGKDQGAFSAGIIATTGAVNITQAQAGSGALTLTGVSSSGAVTINLGTGTGAGDVSISGLNSKGAFSLTADQASDLTLTNITASASITVNVGGSGSITASSLDTGGALSITKTLGSGEAAVMGAISGGSVSITISGASGHVSANTIDAGAFTFNATDSGEGSDAQNLGVLSASGVVSVSLGSTTDLLASSIVVASAGATITKGTGSSDVTVNIGVTADGAISIVGGGSGTISVSTIGTAGGFSFNGENMSNTGGDAGEYFSANTITATSGNVTFTYGTGGNAFVDVSAIDTVSGFTLTGASLTTADIAVVALSATQGISIDVGGASGSAVIANIDTDGVFTFNAGNANNLDIDIETLSASAATITLGAVSLAAHANSVSSVDAQTFTLAGGNYREIFSAHDISASAVTISFGDLSDALSVSSITTETFSFAGGDGANFSAVITQLDIGAADFSLTMPELGNGLLINRLGFSASGSIVATHNADTVSASSSSAAGDVVKFEFNMGEDSVVDTLGYFNGGGKELVKVYNFDKDQDVIKSNMKVGTAATAVGTTTAASIIGGALGASISASDLTAGSATATFVYNGDMFFIGASATIDSTFSDGEVVFQFVGITDISGGDLTSI